MPTIDQARDWYDANDPVHGLGHILRVLALAERMGEELGADLEVLQAMPLERTQVRVMIANLTSRRRRFLPERY